MEAPRYRLHVREAESAACYGDAARQPNPDISQPSIHKGVLEESRGAATLIVAGLRGLRARTGAPGQRIAVASGAWLTWMENLAERLKRGCKDRLVGQPHTIASLIRRTPMHRS